MNLDAAQDLAGAEALIQEAEAALAAEDPGRALPLLYQAEEAGAEPDRCSGNRWMAHMLAGDLRAAWRESDAIRGRGAPDPHRFWDGRPLEGQRVILRCLHGFGDAVQLFRFLPRLRAVASHLTVEVPPRLLEIAPYFDGMGDVITWGEQAPAQPPVWDTQIEVMEVPYLLRVGGEDLQPTRGYLRLPHELLAATERQIGARVRPRVGVVWAAGHWNPTRSIPVSLLAPLARLSGAEFWNLQGGEDRHGCATLPGAAWHDAYDCGEGILPLAAVIQQMDLVISVDTLAAHLAGALGVPCWLLLQQRADWRWMAGREDTPWYPSLRLVRQPVQGDWDALLQRVTADLEAWLTRNHGASC